MTVAFILPAKGGFAICDKESTDRFAFHLNPKWLPTFSSAAYRGSSCLHLPSKKRPGRKCRWKPGRASSTITYLKHGISAKVLTPPKMTHPTNSRNSSNRFTQRNRYFKVDDQSLLLEAIRNEILAIFLGFTLGTSSEIVLSYTRDNQENHPKCIQVPQLEREAKIQLQVSLRSIWILWTYFSLIRCRKHSEAISCASGASSFLAMKTIGGEACVETFPIWPKRQVA